MVPAASIVATALRSTLGLSFFSSMSHGFLTSICHFTAPQPKRFPIRPLAFIRSTARGPPRGANDKKVLALRFRSVVGFAHKSLLGTHVPRLKISHRLF